MAGAWKQLGGGVMMFVPTVDPEFATTQDSLEKLSLCDGEVHSPLKVTHDSSTQNEVIPSIENARHAVIDIDSEDEVVYTPDTCTLSAGSEDEDSNSGPSNMTSRSVLTTNTAPHNDLYSQLRSFAQSLDILSTEEDLVTSRRAKSDEYDSDRTDFLETRTPCPRRTSNRQPRQTVSKSHFSVAPTNPVRRTLDFGVAKSKIVKRSSPNSNKITAPEYSLPHRWTEEEREYLCCLWRWFKREPTDFAATFNQHFGMSLSMSKVRDQFENHIKLYGPAAFPVYRDVLSVPFHDPGLYSNLLEVIASTAHGLAIQLHRLEAEEVTSHGKAAKARSALTRKCFQSLVRKAALEEKARLSQSQIPKTTHHRPVLGGMPLATSALLDEEEVLSDAEDFNPSLTTSQLSQDSPSKGRIAFRVWDADSRTKFSEQDGFVSEAHTLWRGGYLKPFSDNGEGRNALMFLSNIHLCMKGGGSSSSAFVSVSISLLQVLARHASSMKRPMIAMVDLEHPLLQDKNKVIHAHEMLKMLKADGQAWWAKYKGHAEFMIWANCPIECVIHRFPLSDLQDLAEADQSCAELMNLSIVQSGQRVRKVSSQLREKNIVLNTRVAKAMGLMAKTFGLDGEHILAEHIAAFVARVVDGWYIVVPTIDIQTKSSLATTFAKALRSCGRMQVVMGAFMDGIEEGYKITTYYASRRS